MAAEAVARISATESAIFELVNMADNSRIAK
jgi:hypothetical protein